MAAPAIKLVGDGYYEGGSRMGLAFSPIREDNI